nr:MAG TPA: hypothetical protein [Caudoviricetes sp.]
MAQYLLNYLDGSIPQTVDWSFRQGNGGHRLYAEAGSLSLESTSAGTKVAAFNPINGINDVEALVRFTLSSDRGKQGIVSLRYGGTTEANTTGYTLSGSIIGNRGHLAVDEGGTGNIVWAPWDYRPNTLYWARFRVQGDQVMAKVWNHGQAEPANWTIHATNKVRPTGDYSGLHTYMVGTVRYSFISFGTNGDAAPPPHFTLKSANTSHGVVDNNVRVVKDMPTSTPIVGFGGGYAGGAYGRGYAEATYPSSPNTELKIFGATHNHSATSVSITQIHKLNPDNATHRHLSGQVSIIQAHKISVANTTHSQTSDIATTIENKTLTLNGASHSLISNNITLDQSSILKIVDTIHSIASKDIKLSEKNWLSVDDAGHDIKSEQLDVIYSTLLGVPASTVHNVRAEDARIAQDAILAVDNSLTAIRDSLSAITNWDRYNKDFGIFIPSRTSAGVMSSEQVYALLQFVDNFIWAGEDDTLMIEEGGDKADSTQIYKPETIERGQL